MRTGIAKGYRLNLEPLEDRLAAAAIPVPAPDVTSALLAGQQVVPSAAPPGGAAAQSHGGGLTLAIVTEAYPLPHELDQPGVPAARPFPTDPSGVFFVVVFQVRR